MANNIEKQLKEISERLEQGVKEIFTSERYTEYLNTMSKFHNYSFNNTLLITMQKPEATLVAGYQAWQKKFNRQVKRGEKGIQIIAPAPYKEKQEIEKKRFSSKYSFYYYYPNYFKKCWFAIKNFKNILQLSPNVISKYGRFKIFIPTRFLRSRINLFEKLRS